MTLRKTQIGLAIFMLLSGVGIGLLLLTSLQKADAKPRPTVTSIAAQSRKLVFDEEFSDNKLDSSKWNTCYDSYSVDFYGCTNHGNNESEWYKKEQVSVSGGNLILTAEKKTTVGSTIDGKARNYDYASGMIATGRYLTETPPKWTGSHGYFEARINVPAGQGIWPAFWLLPVDHDWPPEIDIMELLGNSPNQVLTTYHWKGEEGKGVPQDSSTFTSPTPIANSWHVFAIDWRQGVINWYV